MSSKNTNLRIEMKRGDSRGVTTPPLGYFAVSLIIDWLCEAFSPLFLLFSPFYFSLSVPCDLFLVARWHWCQMMSLHILRSDSDLFSPLRFFSVSFLFLCFYSRFLLLKFEAFETCCLTASLCYLSKLIFLLLPHGAWLFRPIELSTLLNWLYYSNLIV